MRKVQIVHVTREIDFVVFAPQARVETFFFGHARNREPAIIMRRKQQALIGQREYLLVHRAVHGVRIALLEIGAARPANKQAIAGESAGSVAQHVTDAAVRVAWCRAHFDLLIAKSDFISML